MLFSFAIINNRGESMLSICFTIVSVVFCLILVIVFFGRDRIDSVENRVYSYIVLSTFFSGLMEIITFGQVQSGISPADPNYHFTMKLLFTGFLSWTYFFTLYICYFLHMPRWLPSRHELLYHILSETQYLLF